MDDETSSNATGLSIADIQSALSSNDMKLSMLGMDACLMSGLETAYFLRDYYDYLVASSEEGMGSFSYQDILTAIARNLDTPDKIGKEAAMAALEYRYLQHRGTPAQIETWAVLDGKKAEAAAAALNELAKELYAFAESGDQKIKPVHEAIIYGAWLEARLRAKDYGVGEKDRNTNYDYVDAAAFLQRLEEELANMKETYKNDPEAAAYLEKLLSPGEGSSVLQRALEAVKDLTVANYSAERVSFVFSKGVIAGGKTVPDENTMKELYGDYFTSGTSLYIPYYNRNAIDAYTTGTKGSWAKGMELLFGKDSDYRKLMDGYLSYIQLSTEGPGNGEQKRRENLKKELMAGRRLLFDEKGEIARDENGNELYEEGEKGRIIGYDDILDMKWDQAGKDPQNKYLSIMIKADAYNDGELSSFTSGDPYRDLIDTSDAMKLYISRRVEAIRSDSSGDDSGKSWMLDIVIGERDVTVHSLDGVDSAIKVFSDLIQFTTYDAVQGTAVMKDDVGKEQRITEIVMPYHGVQDFDLEKAGAVDAALGLAPDKNRDYGAYTILRGSVTLNDANVNAPNDVCLVFGPDSTGKTVYLGAAERAAKTGSFPVGESAYNYNAISGIRGISIGHVFAAASATGSTTLDYAEPGYVILETNHYYPVTGDSEIVLKKGLSHSEVPGTSDQNLYYFGIAPGEEYNLEDVYLLNKPLGETKDAEDQGQIMYYEELTGTENVPEAGQEASGAGGELNNGKAVTSAMQQTGAGARNEGESTVEVTEMPPESEEQDEGGNDTDETITDGIIADETITDENAESESITGESTADETVTGENKDEAEPDEGSAEISEAGDGKENTSETAGEQNEQDPADESTGEAEDASSDSSSITQDPEDGKTEDSGNVESAGSEESSTEGSSAESGSSSTESSSTESSDTEGSSAESESGNAESSNESAGQE